MASRQPHRHTNQPREVSSGPISMCFQRLSVGQKDSQEGVFEDEDGIYMIVGRIDNISEHIKDGPQATTPQNIARLYKRNQQLPAHALQGPFVILIWDKRSQKLTCARDKLGLRPFYYLYKDGVFAASSDLVPLLSLPEASNTPDEKMVAEFLTYQLRSRSRTLYQCIRRLPPAHLGTFDGRAFNTRQFWRFDPKPIQLESAQAYAHEFKNRLTQAVSRRLEDSPLVGAELSGGLDSSSVVYIATAPQPDLRTYCVSCAGFSCDETTLASLAADTFESRHTAVPAQFLEMEAFEEQVQTTRDLPFYPNGTVAFGLKRTAQRDGVRVLLTGAGGDDWFTGSPYHYADMLRAGQFRNAWRQWRADLETHNVLSTPPSLIRHGIYPSLPRRATLLLRTLRRPPLPKFPNLSWLESIGHTHRPKPWWFDRGNQTIAQTHLATGLTSAWVAHGFEMEERANALFQLEARHPFYDETLMTFGLNLPEQQRWSGPTTKVVLRNAMTNLPEKILQRKDKAEFSPIVIEQLLRVGASGLFDELQITHRERWVSAQPVQQAFRELQFTKPSPAHYDLAWRLWTIFGIELWYRSL